MSRRAASAGAAGLLALLAVGCTSDSGSDTAQPARPEEPPVRVVVTRDDGTLPPGCGPRRVATAVTRFLDAVESGDRRRVDVLLAPPARFQWFSSAESGNGVDRTFTAYGRTSDVGPAGGSDVDERPKLVRYLSERGAAGERWRLVAISVRRIAPRAWFASIPDVVAGVEYSLVRESSDVRVRGGRNRIATGKGALACADRRVLAWSMGLESESAPPRLGVELCPRPKSRLSPEQRSRTLAVVCTPARSRD
ncbi:MAG: hypothetical protein M3340_15400 [Actinomycetota bacterium]|nr:hypothetical protein [Actinomycetota bacterium]